MYTDASALSSSELETLLSGIDNARVALIGDLCLDMYWDADMTKSELSRETPHHPLPVVAERFSPGGASNVAANLAALQPKNLYVLGVIGNDWRSGLLLEAMEACNIPTDRILRDAERVTNTYLKPMRHGISDVVYEDPRIDFENYTALSEETESRLLTLLLQTAEEADVICVNDQFKFGCITPKIREALCTLGKQGKTVLVDSRDRMKAYHHVTVKPNEVEMSRAFGDGSALSLDALATLANRVAAQNGCPTLTTLGPHGCFVADGKTVVRCPAQTVEPPIDFCGAGDTFLSGFAATLAGGASPVDAARVANLCSAVTIRKIGITGTATRDEIRTILQF